MAIRFQDNRMSPPGAEISQTRRFIGSLVLLGAMAALGGCGGGSTYNVQNPPPPPGSNLSIAFQSTPVNSLPINTTTDLTAVVTNDASNDGVDWSVTCENTNDCGSLNTYHSASGSAVTYTPARTLSGNSEAVNIVAFASVDHTKNALAAITITAFGSILNGTYIFEAKGSDANLQPFQLAGALVLDGNGGITSGQQTLNYVSGSLTTPITSGSSYFVGPDGRGTITIQTTDQSGQPITENFSLVVLSSSQILIAESQLDAPQTSVGTMDLQTNVAPPTGSFAFVASGTDAAGTPAAFGGVLNIDSPGAISGKGSLADEDYNGTFTTCPSPRGISGTVSEPNPNPLGTVTIALSGAPCLGSVQFTGYIVDAAHIKLIESDNNGASGFSTAGLAIGQGSAAGQFNITPFTGSYVWAVQGQDLGSFEPSSLISLGVLTADGAGNLTDGFTDSLMILSAGTGSPAQTSGQFTGTYAVDTKGIGRVRASLKQFSSPVPFRPQLILYLTGNGNPALVLDAGGESPNYPSLGTGIAYPQAPAPLAFTGKYGFSFTQQNGTENDGTGQMLANSGILSGTLDDSGSGFGVPLSGSFGALDSFGRSSGTFPSPAGSTAVDYYLIDQSHAFFVETDLLNPGSGQVGLGVIAMRSPVCAGCP
jgi:hypothetical protein